MNADRITLDSLVRASAAAFPGRIAVSDEDRTLTYAEFDAEIDALACALLALGVRKGARVASLLFNEWQAFVVYFAVVRIGAVIVPINHRLVTAEIGFQLGHADCAVLVYADDLHERIAPLADTVPVRHWIASGSRAPHVGGLRVETLLDQQRGRTPSTEWTVTREDVSGIWYTSGTTGTPKGAVTTHASGVWAATCMALTMGLTSRGKLIGVAPAFHRGPMENFHVAGFLNGCTHILMRHFDPAAMLRLIQDERITHGFIVPTMTFAVLSLPERHDFDLSSMRCWLTASAPFPEEYRAALQRETTLPPDVVFNAYGITESLMNTCLWPQDAAAHPGSVGQPAPGVLLRIVDRDRNPAPAGTVGEISVSAPSIASTYLGNAEEWAAVTYDDGDRTWYLSGDLGRLDDEGYLYVVDRAKDMVISGGENVYSIEVERVLAQLPGVAEVAVIGVADERWGECVAAAIVRAPGSTLDHAEVLAGCVGKLAPYKHPRRIYFVDQLPRNTLGKVQKPQVRAMLAGLVSEPA